MEVPGAGVAADRGAAIGFRGTRDGTASAGFVGRQGTVAEARPFGTATAAIPDHRGFSALQFP